jgi:uncharacterized cupredoxin-like copper-binding protein
MNKPLIGALLAIALACTAFPLVAHSATGRIVAITLLDPSDPSISGMVMRTDTPTVKAGRVTLEAVNQSKNLVHEVLVVPAPPEGSDLPYDTNKDTVIERRVRSLGEIPDLKPGVRGKLTVNLKPGTYLLLCNQPGHYKSGMWAKLVVEK